MTHNIGQDQLDLRRQDARENGPDPVIGAGITLFGIFLMGTGGATDGHYVFDAGVLVGLGGAITFVVCVALSALRQRRLTQVSGGSAPLSSSGSSAPQTPESRIRSVVRSLGAYPSG